MSLVEFFFNPDFRESLSDNQRKTKKRPKPTEEEEKKSKEEFGKIIQRIRAKELLDRLIDNIRYDVIDHTNITEKTFKEFFRKQKTKEWLIDEMWEEYSEFISTYK